MPKYWWVNQGNTYTSEKDQGILFASIGSKSGRHVESWSAVGDVKPGDVVLHYSDGHIRALSKVSKAAVRTPHPDGHVARSSTGMHTEDLGLLVTADYVELSDPISLEEIPLEVRSAKNGPFVGGKTPGKPQQGYLFPLGNGFMLAFRKLFIDRLPFDPW